MTQCLAPLLPPPTRFLLEQLCVLEPAGAAGDQFTLTAADLTAEAQRQGVTGLLYQWARRRAGTPLADALTPQLAPAHEANVLHALRQIEDTARAVDLLKDAGVEALVLKGPLLSKRYYGDYGVRGAGDVDLLVAEQDVPRADRALRNAGHVRIKPQRELSPRRLALYLDTQHEFGYRPPNGPGLLELHWRFADCRLLCPSDFATLHARGETLPTAGRPLRTLCPADTFVHLATHGAMDGWSRLKWIADMPRVFSALPPHDRERVTGGTERAGDQRILELALILAGARAPAADRAWLQSAAAYVAGRLATPHPRTLPAAARVRHALAARRFASTLLPDAAVRRAVSYCNQIMPTDFDHAPLPDLLTPLLPYLARIHRALRAPAATR